MKNIFTFHFLSCFLCYLLFSHSSSFSLTGNNLNHQDNLVLQPISQIEYDVSQSKQFQSYSVLTHCSKNILLSWTCKICPELTQLQQTVYIDNNVTNAVAFLGYHQKLNAVVIMFRGTQDAKNWIEDLSYLSVPYSRCHNCSVHEGFYLTYLSLSLQINSQIQKFRSKYPKVDIYTVGSSLGAALATLAAAQIQFTYGGVKELHTFGCPRVGNANFAQFLSLKLNKNIKRVVHKADIVPHVPQMNAPFYFHPAYEIWFDEQMKNYRICNQSGEDASCSNSLKPNYSIPDHISYWRKPNVTEICQ